MSGPADMPSARDLSDAVDVIVDLCDHALDDDLPTLRAAITVMQRYQDGADQ